MRNTWLPAMALCLCAAAMPIHDAFAQRGRPKPIRNGEVLSGELRLMRSRANGKRISTYQVVITEGRRIPGPDGLCNLETGPETFQIITHDDTDVIRLKPYIGKTISIKANEMECATRVEQVSDALVSKWSIVQ
ncbi:hypothetical protein [Bradyrhizobium sp. LHD-71]|uniref:hypothetical protein n=1 Tax=Bradyrhizobium sp. LHD-71 TaxID=3072141 RepID=UPI00281015D7|nr:hypothetical protein [Bradyrhizobium sp. LHD-71]MDQ8727265.1 hypothetical protein [Bradyrhizobium sp. LHD-71]